MIKKLLASRHLNENECAGFSRSSSVLLSAGWSLPRTFEALIKQSRNKNLSAALSLMTEKIQKGSSLSEAMQSHERLFGPLICAVVKATEPVGTLGNGISKCADYYEKNEALHAMCVKKLRDALLYTSKPAGVPTNKRPFGVSSARFPPAFSVASSSQSTVESTKVRLGTPLTYRRPAWGSIARGEGYKAGL